MTLFSERRLLSKTQEQINKQRKAAGLSPISTAKPTRVVTPEGTITATQANVQLQEANRTPQPVTYETYMDPATGRDKRYDYNEYGVREYEPSREGTLSTQKVSPQKSTTSVTSSPFAQPLAGSQSRKPFTGADLTAAADKRRRQRLVDLGIPESEYEATKAILDQGGRYAGTDNGRPYFLMPDGTKVYSNLNEASTSTVMETHGTDYEGEITQEDDERQQEEKRMMLEKQGETPTDTTEEDTLSSPISSAVGAAFASLTPEQQSLIGPAWQGIQASITASIKANRAQTTAAFADIEKTYGGIQAELADMKADRETSRKFIQGLLSEAKADQDEALAEQQKSENERLAWDAYKQRTEIDRRKREDHEALVAQLALSGAGGQLAAVQTVMASDARYDSALDDLAIQVGYARTDIAAKFAGLYSENNQNYIQSSINNWKEAEAAIENIRTQGILNDKTKLEAEQSLVQKYWDNENGLRKEMSERTMDLVQEASSTVLQSKLEAQKEARWQYEQQWEEYKFTAQQQRLSEQFGLQMADRQDARSLQTDMQGFQKANQKVSQIRSAIESNKVMIPYRRDIEPLYANMKSAYEAGDNAFSDRALAKIYEKMIEPTSVVMPGEYLDIASSAPLLNKVAGKFKRILEGGQSWTNEERKQLYELAGKFHDTYKKRYDEAADQFYTDIDWFNRLNPNNAITYDQVGLPNYSSQGVRSILEERAEPGIFPDGDGGGEELSIASPFIHIGKITQQFNTPIASRAEGGLYDESTVKAWSGTHKGIDIAIPQGTSLQSPISGTVTYAGVDGGWGGTIVIEDVEGNEVRLSHLSSIGIRPGMKIRKGESIAQSGGSKGTKGAGNSTGPHIDLRVKVNGKYVDPLKFRSAT